MKVGDTLIVPGFICRDIKVIDPQFKGNTLTVTGIHKCMYSFKETTYTCPDAVVNMMIKRS